VEVSPPTDQASTAKPLVLMGFAESLAAIEACWSLHAAGFRVAAFTREGTKPGLRHCRGVSVHPVCPPEKDAGATVEAVAALARKLGAAVVLALDDNSLWVCARLHLEGPRVASPVGLGADCALDKAQQLELATRSGFLVPASRVVQDIREVAQIGSPVVVKPARALYEVAGALVRPTGVVCADSQELEHAATKAWPPPLLVQPLIHGVGEGLFGHATAQGVTAWSAHQRLRMVNPQGSASSACTSHPVDPTLVEPAERFLRALRWRGLFMLEFLRDREGRPWFMEFNGRAWGSTALSRRRGYEYPAWTVAAALDPGFIPVAPASPPPIRCRHLGMEIAHLAFILRGPQSSAISQWPSTWRTVGNLLKVSRRDRLYNWSRSEPWVLVDDTVQTLNYYRRRFARRAA